MPLYRLGMRTISRGRGELAVATAAYISSERLYLEAEDRHYDFRWRAADVAHTELVGAHGWTREQVWNEAEWAEWEIRWDGVTARETVVALPKELSLAEQIELARELARYLSHRYGVPVDLAVHMPPAQGENDAQNPHAHLLFTTRVMRPSGLAEKTKAWDHARTGGRELTIVRREWRRLYNGALERAGLEQRVDERSYRDQGLERLPGVHLGRELWNLEQAGTRTAAGDYNRGVEILNRMQHLVGSELDWDWEQKARSFSDADGHLVYAVCRAKLFQAVQARAALEQDPWALPAEAAVEIQAQIQALAALRDLVRPCRDAVVEERIRRRSRERERRRERERGSRGRAA